MLCVRNHNRHDVDPPSTTRKHWSLFFLDQTGKEQRDHFHSRSACVLLRRTMVAMHTPCVVHSRKIIFNANWYFLCSFEPRSTRHGTNVRTNCFMPYFDSKKQYFIKMWLLRGQLFTLYGKVAKFGFKRKNIDIR